MAADEELRAIYNIFTDVWKVYKKYADVRSDDEYWENVVNEINALDKKYDNDRLCRDLILAVISELERISKKLTQNETKKGLF